ncbi:hypothetical protein E2562_019002 [Oryza meyeriana var. granulata]|uniref:Uncharacterized protein n=1 Tax=Oryza meyeriana var. granulata TaxID=110450 RepID=A0A6G1DKW9_9ORYZ|nr:hypothetical protein E2562_019002 [Oryza meyeriana var. granulata]
MGLRRPSCIVPYHLGAATARATRGAAARRPGCWEWRVVLPLDLEADGEQVEDQRRRPTRDTLRIIDAGGRDGHGMTGKEGKDLPNARALGGDYGPVSFYLHGD